MLAVAATFYAIDANGNEGPISDPCAFAVDRSPPDPPYLLAKNGLLVPSSFSLEGFSEKGEVLAYEGSRSLGRDSRPTVPGRSERGWPTAHIP